MEVIFPHEIVFSNKNAMSVSDVANSLIGNEQILLSIGKVLEGCFSGLVIDKINIEFKFASTNSPLKEAFSAGILFTFQDKLKEEVPKMIESLTGIHTEDKYTTIVTLIFLVIALYGIETAWAMFKKSKDDSQKPEPNLSITNNYGTVLNYTGNMMGVSPAELDHAVRQAIPQKQKSRIAKAALAFIRPAKNEKGASIQGAGQLISAATIEESPSELDIVLGDDDEIQEPFNQVEVIIHAKDKDHSSSGWAGHITGICDRRLKMKLFPSIKPPQIFGKDRIVADIILMSKIQDGGVMTPYLFHILNVYNT